VKHITVHFERRASAARRSRDAASLWKSVAEIGRSLQLLLLGESCMKSARMLLDDSTAVRRALNSAAALSSPIYSVARRRRSARAGRKSIEKPREDEAEVSRPRGSK